MHFLWEMCCQHLRQSCFGHFWEENCKVDMLGMLSFPPHGRPEALLSAPKSPQENMVVLKALHASPVCLVALRV